MKALFFLLVDVLFHVAAFVAILIIVAGFIFIVMAPFILIGISVYG